MSLLHNFQNNKLMRTKQKVVVEERLFKYLKSSTPPCISFSTILNISSRVNLAPLKPLYVSLHQKVVVALDFSLLCEYNYSFQKEQYPLREEPIYAKIQLVDLSNSFFFGEAQLHNLLVPNVNMVVVYQENSPHCLFLIYFYFLQTQLCFH